MIEALLVVTLLGLAWALGSSYVLAQRLRAVEQTLHQERAEMGSRLEALEDLARDRWLAESATLGGQVSAMVAVLEDTAQRTSTTLAEREAALAGLLAQADQRLGQTATEPLAAPTAGGRLAPAQTPAKRRPARRDGETGRDGRRPRHRDPLDPRSAVHRLAADGLSAPEIARLTGLGIGEIDLILRLSQPVALQQPS